MIGQTAWLYILEKGATEEQVKKAQRDLDEQLANDSEYRAEITMGFKHRLEVVTWEQRQAELKELYSKGYGYNNTDVYECKCRQCKCVFYAQYPYAWYCTRRCTNDAYIEKRKKTYEYKGWIGVCEYCNKEYDTWRVDAKYCSDSHRVLACLKRKKNKKAKK
jgi:hypothetical protein